MRMRKEMLGLGAYVSKKIIEEGWKVGYMSRDEAMHEGDSGWAFMAEMKMMTMLMIIEILHFAAYMRCADWTLL